MSYINWKHCIAQVMRAGQGTTPFQGIREGIGWQIEVVWRLGGHAIFRMPGRRLATRRCCDASSVGDVMMSKSLDSMRVR